METENGLTFSKVLFVLQHQSQFNNSSLIKAGKSHIFISLITNCLAHDIDEASHNNFEMPTSKDPIPNTNNNQRMDTDGYCYNTLCSCYIEVNRFINVALQEIASG